MNTFDYGSGSKPGKPTTNALYDKAFREANSCIQCGYCLPVCPTYASMGKETASPRGRIHLVKLAAEGKIDPIRDMMDPIQLCLGCRACETACPVGVPYGHILEAAKEEIYRSKMGNPGSSGKLTRFILHHVFPYPRRLRRLGNVVRFLQKTKVLSAIRKTGIIGKFSAPMAQFEKALPTLPPGKRLEFGRTIPAQTAPKARVALFTGCIMDAMMYRIHNLTAALLSSVGLEVIVASGQKCCGALHSHQGMTQEAKALARDNIAAFERSGADWAVNNAGGCGAALKEYAHLFADDPDWADRARRFSEKSKDISEILLQYGPLPFKEKLEAVVTYQDSCHLLNVQKVADAPRKLLRLIPGIHYAEMKGADRCCGSGGIYNLLHFDESMVILDEKMQHVKAAGAMVVVSGNPGCMLQLQVGIEREGLSRQVRSLHLVEVLAEACGID